MGPARTSSDLKTCNECGTHIYMGSLTVTDEGDLCRSYTMKIPDPSACSVCGVPHQKGETFYHSSSSKICTGCHWHQLEKGGSSTDDLNMCSNCGKQTQAMHPSKHGPIYRGCAHLVPNPDKCPLCQKKSNKWSHSPNRKICEACYQRSWKSRQSKKGVKPYHHYYYHGLNCEHE